MKFNDDVWKIITSYLFDEKEVQYRYLIKQINENLKKVQQKKRGLEIFESIMTEVLCVSDYDADYDW
jgi:hypothetical protein